jgi:hypothetical protein
MFETSYAHVEAALVKAYGVPDKAIGAFRGRIGNLQKLGLFGKKNMPGRGTPLSYGPDQFHRLVFVCELFELGNVPPAIVMALVKTLWDRKLVSIFKQAEHAAERDPGPDDIVLHMGGLRLMTGAMTGSKGRPSTAVWEDAVPNVNACTVRKLSDHMGSWIRMEAYPPRAIIVNLSSRLRKFHAALADTHPAEIKRARDEAK